MKIGDKAAILAAKSTKMDWEVKVADLSGMTFAELDAYIEGNVKDLASARAYLKKLSKEVLALMKLIKNY